MGPREEGESFFCFPGGCEQARHVVQSGGHLDVALCVRVFLLVFLCFMRCCNCLVGPYVQIVLKVKHKVGREKGGGGGRCGCGMGARGGR